MTRSADHDGLSVAVLVPCFNEALAIGTVVRDFQRHLPGCAVHVYDNNSHDGTMDVARAAGAVVHREPHQGKGHVVRRMFADIEADVYLLVDGDDTYDAASAAAMVDLLLRERVDMVVGTRQDDGGDRTYRPGHRFGNAFFTRAVATFFGRQFTDILSGYRCLSRRFVKSFPALAGGFEVEAELTIHSLDLRLPTAELATPYRHRPTGSESKLRTYRDGTRILLLVLTLVKEFRPFLFFGTIAATLVALSLLLGVPVVLEYLETGLVPRFPTAILATGIMILAFLFLTAGVILDSVARMRREMKRLAYLDVARRSDRRTETLLERGDDELFAAVRGRAAPSAIRGDAPLG